MRHRREGKPKHHRVTPALSYRSFRPNVPFAELVCLSKSSVAEEYYAERSGIRRVS
jgi:hypothetical protein